MGRRGLGGCVEASLALAAQILELSRLLRFFVAPMTCDDRIRRRIDAALADEFAKAPGEIGAFQEEGIRYQGRRQGETPIQVAVHVAVHVAVRVANTAPALLGMPRSLIV